MKFEGLKLEWSAWFSTTRRYLYWKRCQTELSSQTLLGKLYSLSIFANADDLE